MQKSLLGLLLALSTVACGGSSEPTPATGGAGASSGAPSQGILLSLGSTVYKDNCLTCHGSEGAGDGAGALALDPKPRDFRLPEWQDSVTDEHIRKVILEGGEAVGLSAGMAPIPALAGQDLKLDAVVAYVRSLRK